MTAGETTQLVKRVLCKHEGLNLSPKTHIKKLSTVVTDVLLGLTGQAATLPNDRPPGLRKQDEWLLRSHT